MKNNFTDFNNNKHLKERTISSLALKLIEKFFSLGVQFIISIILARLLSPSDYGLIALVDVFIVISTAFIESGFGVGLVQKKDLNNIDVDTMFWSSIISSIFIYCLIFLISPIVANYYENDSVTAILRVYAITVVIAGINSIFNSILSRNLDYKKQLIASSISTAVSGTAGIAFAFFGFGAWSLVFQQIAFQCIYFIIMFFMVRYIPKFEFSFASFKKIFGFTWKIVLAKLIATLFNKIRDLIVGKQYSSESLGFYNKGSQYPSIIATAIDYSIQSVMLSVYSKTQNDVVQLKSIVRRSMKTSAFILFPIMMGLAAVADPLIRLLLTEKWISCVPFLQIACLMYMLQPVNTANSQALNAIGRSDVSLKLEIFKRIFAIVLITVCVIVQNIYLLAFSAVLVSLFGWILYMFVNRKMLNYTISEQLFDIVPTLALSIAMGLAVYFLSYIQLNYIILLLIQITFGIIFYVGASWLFKMESFIYCINIVKEFIKKKKNKIPSNGEN